MYRLEREEFVKSPYLALWSVLGFQAGYVNAFGFFACGRYVSHVTGFGTQIGVALANQRGAFALELLGFPLSFIAGAFVSACLTSARIETQLRPRFDVVTALIPALLASLVVAGGSGIFGPFGEDLVQGRDFVLLFLLSFVCGMQNGCFAVLTKGQIRTTHLTGISTDIGTDLARLAFGRLQGIENQLTRRTNASRLLTLLSFAGGSIVSALVGPQFEYMSLIVPLVTACGVFVAVRQFGKTLDTRFKASSRPSGVAHSGSPRAMESRDSCRSEKRAVEIESAPSLLEAEVESD
jgi:uncharacterized membrane protein YoaK (UPF0700 family)